MIQINGQKYPFRGLNTDGSEYERPIGTFSEMKNMYVTKDKTMLKSRGGFVKDVDLPSTLYLNTTSYIITSDSSAGNVASGMTLYDALHMNWFKVRTPEEKVIRIFVGVYTYTPHADLGAKYVLRTLMYPYWNGSAFVDKWKDITSYYIDMNDGYTVLDGVTYTEYTTDLNLVPCLADMPGGYIYVNRKTSTGTNYFGTAGAFTQHYAEADKIIYNASASVSKVVLPDDDYARYSLKCENLGDHTSWDETSGEMRYHKNLTTGRIPYEDLYSTTATDLTSYTVRSYNIDEMICVSYNSNTTSRPSYTLCLNYLSKTDFGTGKIASRYDFAHDSDSDTYINNIYDSLLVYGFPGYDNVATALSGNGVSHKIPVARHIQGTGILSTSTINKIFFYDTSTGWAVGNSGVLYKTTDGGLTWTSMDSTTTADINDVHFPTSTTGYIVANGGIMRKSTDGGVTWATITISGVGTKNLLSLGFASANTGWVGTINGILYKTTDGGSSFSSKTLSSTNDVISISVVDANNAFLCTYFSVQSTTDGGTTWTNKYTGGFGKTFYKVQALDANNVYVQISSKGTLLKKTTDAGTSWTSCAISGLNYDDYVIDFSFQSSTLGYILTNNNVYVTTDSAATIVVKTPITPGYAVSIDALSTTTCYIAGYYGYSVLCTDAGSISDTLSSYDKITGKIVLSGDTLLYTGREANVQYLISDVTISKTTADFIFTEIDLHGRYGCYKSFGTIESYWQSSHSEIVLENYNSTDKRNYDVNNFIDDSSDYCSPKRGSEMGFDVDDQFFFYLTVLHNYARAGLHYDNNKGVQVTTGYTVPIVMIQIPSNYNRNITHCQVGMKVSDEDEIDDYLQSHMVINHEIVGSNDWTFRTCLVEKQGLDYIISENHHKQYSYTKEFRIDKNRYDKVNLAGTHLDVTGNPIYSNEQDYSDLDPALATNTKNGLPNIMCLDNSVASNLNAVVRDKLFATDARLNEYQYGTIGDTSKADNQVLFSPNALYGGNYHLYNAIEYQLICKDIGKITGLTSIAMVQDTDSAFQENRNNLLVLGDDGYMYFDLRDGLDPSKGGSWPNTTYFGDCCIAPKSVVTHGGVAFYAGRKGVYVFYGQRQIDITKLGASSISDEWQAISDTYKAQAVGMYNPIDKQYWLMLQNGSTQKIYVFDFGYTLFDWENGDIFRYEETPSVWSISDKSSIRYIDGNIYMFVFSSDVYGALKYSKTTYTDYDALNDLNRTYAGSAKTNKIYPAKYESRFDVMSIVYTANGMTFTGYANSEYNTVTLPNGTYHKEYKIPPTFKGRGLTFQEEISMDSVGLAEVNTLLMKINTDIHQRRLVKNNG